MIKVGKYSIKRSDKLNLVLLEEYKKKDKETKQPTGELADKWLGYYPTLKEAASAMLDRIASDGVDGEDPEAIFLLIAKIDEAKKYIAEAVKNAEI